VEPIKFKYKVMYKTRTKVMEHVSIYGYVSFVFGLLLLIGLVFSHGWP
jgi:Sec-independent protein secretion pathway component TatC